tara:strand:- start:68 stop:505 length:438 start_codon:yes stop_codon:yes gene_type:complete
MLLIEILELESNIKNSDWFSKNDLYVKIIYGSQIRRTTTLWNKNNPKWKQAFVFNYSISDKIKFELYDADKYSPDELLSKFYIDIVDEHSEVKEYNIKGLKINMGNVYYKSRNQYRNILEKNKINESKLNKIKKIIDNHISSFKN